MNRRSVTLLLLFSAVACLLAGPVLLLMFPIGHVATTTGLLLLAYGALALWIGMRRLET